jgi:hypothetical protein
MENELYLIQLYNHIFNEIIIEFLFKSNQIQGYMRLIPLKKLSAGRKIARRTIKKKSLLIVSSGFDLECFSRHRYSYIEEQKERKRRMSYRYTSETGQVFHRKMREIFLRISFDL